MITHTAALAVFGKARVGLWKMKPTFETITRQHQICAEGEEYADAGVNHTRNGVGDVVGRRIEKNDTQHYAAGLDSSRPLKPDRAPDEQHNA